MKRSRKPALNILVTMVVLLSYPIPAMAYSYGDINEELIANTYLEMAAALAMEPPDFQAAQAALDEVKGEMVKEFGQEQVDLVQHGLEAQDAEEVIYEMQVVLVRNIERRLHNLGEIFGNYQQARTLLAKAFATYEALSAEVVKADPELDQSIKTAFDEALKALGNPGLFGVGEQPADRQQFEEQSQYILTHLKDFFKTEAGYQGHAQGTGQTNVASSGGVGALGNWLPLMVILVVIVGAVLFFVFAGRRHRT